MGRGGVSIMLTLTSHRSYFCLLLRVYSCCFRGTGCRSPAMAAPLVVWQDVKLYFTVGGHYLDTEPTHPCLILIMLERQARIVGSDKYQCESNWFD